MFIGMLTAPLADRPLSQIMDVAKKARIPALEVVAARGLKSMDPFAASPAKIKTIKANLKKRNLTITGIGCYMDLTPTDRNAEKDAAKTMRAGIDLAAKLGVDTVCTLAGLPRDGKSRIQMIEEDVCEVLTPLVKYAAKKKIRIALENWTATNIQNLTQWRRLFEVIPNDNLGFNFDPSHLYWLEIDYLAAVEEFAPRIFHVHAKDTIIYRDVLRSEGVLGEGWWRYCIPGLGNIDWGEFIGVLRKVGYDGVLSIEHEDGSVGLEEGFRIGAQHLSQFI